MPPIWLTNRGLNATICCLSQLCKYSRLTNWRLLSLQPQPEKRRPWGNVYHHLFFLPSSDISDFPTALLYFVPHAALLAPSCSPASFLMQSFFLSHAALLFSLMQPYFIFHAAILLLLSCSPISFHI